MDERLFRTLYSRSLVYNTCWEDPAVDRRALGLTREDVVLVITSAGCNALDYALLAPRRIHAVDANPRQTALLELKLAGVRALDFDDFFRLFGEGFHPDVPGTVRAQAARPARRRSRATTGIATTRGSQASGAAFISTASRGWWRADSRPISPCARTSHPAFARSSAPARWMSSARSMRAAWRRSCGARACAGRCRGSSP